MDLSVAELRRLSDLHKLVITHASLPLVKMAYELDPDALDFDVMCDAFLCGASIDVIRFLVSPAKICARVEPSEEIPSTWELSKVIAWIFLSAIENLEPGGKIAEEYLAILNEIVEELPEAIINQDPITRDQDPITRACPFTLVLSYSSFPRELMQFMASQVPKGTAEFSLGDSLFGTDIPNFRPSLDDHCIEAIGTLLNRVDEVTISSNGFTVDEFTKLLAAIMKSTVKKGTIWVSFRDTVAPALKQLEHTVGRFPFTELSVSHCWDFPNDYPPCPSLFRFLDNLVGFELWVHVVNQFACDALCAMVQGGKLKALNIICKEFETKESFLPLLHAVNTSETLTDLCLSIAKNPKVVTMYHNAILKILEKNTQLEVVFVGEHIHPYLRKEGDKMNTRKHMKRHVNEECFLKQEDGNSKQRRIDYLTLCNLCGRGKATPEGTSLVDFVKLLDIQTLRQKLAFLQFEGEAEEDIINMMQFGLLRQEPSGWLPKEKQGALRADLDWSTCLQRKCKASAPLVRAEIKGE